MKQTIEYLESFAVMALVATGLTGATYHLFRDGGWIERAGGSLWLFLMESPMLALTAAICAVILVWLWRHNRQFERQNGKAATALFYLMTAAGAYYLGHLVLAGTL